MELTDPLEIDHKDRKDVYDYIESHGSVREDKARKALGLEEAAFGAHVAVLRRDGYIRRRENRLEVAYPDESPTTHEVDDTTYTLRAADEDDLTGLVDVMREVAKEGTYIEAETVADMLDEEEVVLRHNELRSRMFYVATIEGDVVGWVHLDLPEAEKLSHTAELTVGLLAKYRGMGIGTDLLERGVEWARTRGFERLYNSVPSTNESAITFLENHGWEIEAVRENHYKIDGEYVDEVMMAVDL